MATSLKPGYKILLLYKIRSPPNVQTREEQAAEELKGTEEGGEGVEINNMLVSINLASI